MFGWHCNDNVNGIASYGNGKQWESWKPFPHTYKTRPCDKYIFTYYYYYILLSLITYY